MTFRHGQIALIDIGCGAIAVCLLGVWLAPDFFTSAQPRRLGADLSEALVLVGASCWLIAGHRYLGRRNAEYLLFIAKRSGNYRPDGRPNWFLGSYLHVDENGHDLDA